MSNLLIILFIIFVVNRFINERPFPEAGGEWPKHKGNLPTRKRPAGRPVNREVVTKTSMPEPQGPGELAAKLEEEEPRATAPTTPATRSPIHQLTGQQLANAIVMAEILGPPKARRQRPR